MVAWDRNVTMGEPEMGMMMIEVRMDDGNGVDVVQLEALLPIAVMPATGPPVKCNISKRYHKTMVSNIK